jgi:hypothetical protein
MLEYGVEVKVKPTAAHCPAGATRSSVIADPHTGRFMACAGETVKWTSFHAERFRQGEIEFVVEAKALPVKAPTTVEVK